MVVGCVWGVGRGSGEGEFIHVSYSIVQ